MSEPGSRSATVGGAIRRLPMALAMVLACLVLACLFTYPLAWNMASAVPVAGDSLFVSWVLAWDYHILTTHPLSLFDANIFFPERNTLAYSEIMLGDLPLSAPVYALTGNPLVAFNALLIGSFALNMLSMGALAWRLTGDRGAATIAAAVFAFAPMRIAELERPQLLATWWLPLGLLALERLVATGRARYLHATVLLIVLELLSSLYLGYAMAIGLVAYGLGALAAGPRPRPLVVIRHGLLAAGLAAVVFVPVARHHLLAARWLGLERTVGELRLNGARPSDLVSIPYGNHLYGGRLPLRAQERALFVGFGALLLAAIGLVARPASSALRRARWGFAAMAATGLLLAFGPVDPGRSYTWLFGWLYELLRLGAPGFSALRFPTRFWLLALTAVAGLAGLGATAVTRSCRRRGRAWLGSALVAATLLVLAGEYASAPLHLAKAASGEAIPAVYRLLATLPEKGAVLELPLGSNTSDIQVQWYGVYRTYYSAYHFRRIVSGYSGYIPPSYGTIATLIERTECGAALRAIARLGVDTVVLHRNELEPETSAHWRSCLTAEHATLAGETEDGLIYTLPVAVPGLDLARLEMLLPDRAVAGLEYRVGVGSADGQAIWVSGEGAPGSGRCCVTVAQRRRCRPFLFPSLLLPGQRFAVPLEVPAAPGSAMIRVELGGGESLVGKLEVESAAPTAPPGAARIVVRRASEHVRRGGRIELEVRLANAGPGGWPSRRPDGKGEVRLAYRFVDATGSVASEGRLRLPHDLFAGQRLELRETLTAPPLPAAYALRLAMVEEGVRQLQQTPDQPEPIEVRVDVGP